MTFSWYQLPRVILTIVLALSNEQILTCVIGVMVVYFINLMVRKTTPSIYLVILLVILIVGGGIMIFAPGNSLRFETEIPRWYSDFNELTFLAHIKVGVLWLMEQIITHLKVYMLLISLLTVSLLESLYLKRLFYVIGTIIFSLTVIKVTLLSGFNLIKAFSFNNLFSNGAWYSRDFLIGVFPYIFWCTVLIYIVVCSCWVTTKPIFTLFCYLAGVFRVLLCFFLQRFSRRGQEYLTVLFFFWC